MICLKALDFDLEIVEEKSMNNFVVREPLLNSKQEIFGYEFSWQFNIRTKEHDREELGLSLIQYVQNTFVGEDNQYLLGSQSIFIELPAEILHEEHLSLLPEQHTVLIFDATKLSHQEIYSLFERITKHGLKILLRGGSFQMLDEVWMPFVSYLELDLATMSAHELAKFYGAVSNLPKLHLIANNVGTWEDFDSCASLNMDVFMGKLHLTQRVNAEPNAVNASQAVIMQLMQELNNDAEIKTLESILKRDPAVSYKLLRYMNSAGIGARSEVTSLQQAVTLIGYQPLYRWLTLLLATSSDDENAAVLMETAIIRGKFLELIAKDILPSNELDSVFVMGMFSLIDRLLGVPMDEALTMIALPEKVKQALMSREGEYGKFLSLIEACELKSGLAGSMAKVAKLDSDVVNHAQLNALTWAKSFMVNA